MAQIKNIDGLSVDEINMELNNGAKFVVFQYCISIVLMSFKQGTSIYFVKAGESTAKYSVGPSIVTFIFGWWGIPWGPIYSIGSLYSNMTGGKDITAEVLESMNSAD